MNRSTDRIRTSHAGRIIDPPDLQELEARVRSGESYDAEAYGDVRRRAIRDSVKRQIDIGLNSIGDGEHGKRRDYAYYSARVSGIEQRPVDPGDVPVTVYKSREREEFAEFFRDYVGFAGAGLRSTSTAPPGKMVAVGPLQHMSLQPLSLELETFQAVLSEFQYEEAFFPLLAPGWLDHFIWNEYYKSEEEYVYALAEILKPEYRAVIDAGFVLQLDDPGLPDSWPTFFPEPDVAEYRKFAELRIEALNYALEGLPEDRIRYHICWGSWNGPHTQDLPFQHVVDLMLRVRAQCYSFEFANVRHMHEWHIWEKTKLPAGKILMPGVIDHTTNVVEHPEVVAERIETFTRLVGRENVIAGTDCGMRGHPQIGWAKLKMLVEGAQLASKRLWSK
jgi:5-methyltetrahydropteroyltriglutamate--homocysteine methyltransferase